MVRAPMGKLIWFPALAGLLLTIGLPARAAETMGAGSTFVFPILAKWGAAYQAKTGNKILTAPAPGLRR